LESSKLDVLITITGNDVGGWGVERPLTIHTGRPFISGNVKVKKFTIATHSPLRSFLNDCLV
jgi:hypothetical protein